jgi:hypothetical protein
VEAFFGESWWAGEDGVRTGGRQQDSPSAAQCVGGCGCVVAFEDEDDFALADDLVPVEVQRFDVEGWAFVDDLACGVGGSWPDRDDDGGANPYPFSLQDAPGPLRETRLAQRGGATLVRLHAPV